MNVATPNNFGGNGKSERLNSNAWFVARWFAGST